MAKITVLRANLDELPEKDDKREAYDEGYNDGHRFGVEECKTDTDDLKSDVDGLHSTVDELRATIDQIRGDVERALDLLENPVFSNDAERAMDLLRAICAEM